MVMHITYTVSLAIETTALAHIVAMETYRCRWLPQRSFGLAIPRHTHTYTWFLFTLAHKHLYTSTEFPLHLYHFGPNAIIFFLHLSFFLLPSPSMPLYMSLCSLRWQSQPQTARPQTTHGPFTVGLMHTAHKTGKNFHNLARSNMIGWLYAKSRSKVTGFVYLETKLCLGTG